MERISINICMRENSNTQNSNPQIQFESKLYNFIDHDNIILIFSISAYMPSRYKDIVNRIGRIGQDIRIWSSTTSYGWYMRQEKGVK